MDAPRRPARTGGFGDDFPDLKVKDMELIIQEHYKTLTLLNAMWFSGGFAGSNHARARCASSTCVHSRVPARSGPHVPKNPSGPVAPVAKTCDLRPAKKRDVFDVTMVLVL